MTTTGASYRQERDQRNDEDEEGFNIDAGCPFPTLSWMFLNSRRNVIDPEPTPEASIEVVSSHPKLFHIDSKSESTAVTYSEANGPTCPPLRQSSSSMTLSSTEDDEVKRKNDSFRKDGRVCGAVVVVVLALFASCMLPKSTFFDASTDGLFSDNCTFVSGGGFSGFYYIQGRLRAKRNELLPEDGGDFLCYSAGCLSVAALLMDQTIEQTIAFGLDAQNRYLTGTMPWLNATEQMIHNVVHNHELQNPHQTKFLRRMHIMTTTYDQWLRPRLIIRTPTSLDELREMLLQTCWIPFVTGFGWARGGHNDAVFLRSQHPRCPRTVAIENDLDIYLNAANVLMPAQLARELFARGLSWVQITA